MAGDSVKAGDPVNVVAGEVAEAILTRLFAVAGHTVDPLEEW